jgi:hypothetical protein
VPGFGPQAAGREAANVGTHQRLGRSGEIEHPAERVVREHHPAVFRLDHDPVAHVRHEAVPQQQVGAAFLAERFLPGGLAEVVRRAALGRHVNTRSDIAVEPAGRRRNRNGRHVDEAIRAIGALAVDRRLERFPR